MSRLAMTYSTPVTFDMENNRHDEITQEEADDSLLGTFPAVLIIGWALLNVFSICDTKQKIP